MCGLSTIRMRYLHTLLLVYCSLGLLAQNKPIQVARTASDCIGAVMINDTVIGPVFSPKGWGNKLEIEGYELGDPFFIQQEHNTVWYKFIAPFDAIFTFELIPAKIDDDFDFMLFKYDGPNFCAEIAAGNKIPVRTNISRKNLGVEGRTGLSESSIFEYVPSGPGSPFSRALKVHKGDVYYLLVDNPFRENEGHTIHLRFRKIKPTQFQKDEEPEEPVYNAPVRQVRFTVTDRNSGERLAANIHIDGLPDGMPATYPSVSQVALDLVSYRTYNYTVLRKGYLLSTGQVIPKGDSLYDISVQLKPMAVGDRINLDQIKFDSDRTVILDKSIPALQQLKEFMLLNPGMEIEIQGHVNGEGKKNKRSYRKLSTARAKAIYDKLVEAGVDRQRMTYAGFGNSRMIYPNPVNNRQAEANRRVEAEVHKL